MSLQSIFTKGNFQPIIRCFHQQRCECYVSRVFVPSSIYNTYEIGSNIFYIRDLMVKNWLGIDIRSEKNTNQVLLKIAHQDSLESGYLRYDYSFDTESSGYFLAIAFWEDVYNLRFVVFGKCKKKNFLDYCSLYNLIKKYKFKILVPVDNSIEYTIQLICRCDRRLADYLQLDSFTKIYNA